MLFTKFIPALLLGTVVQAIPSSRPRAASILPLSTKGRDIIDTNGDIFHYVSTNWPGECDRYAFVDSKLTSASGHQEIMIPEGLQHSSVQDIVAWFPKFGLNSVRLTFAIEMIDDYLANSPNQTLEKSVINALGSSNGTKVLNQILSKNPQFTKNTTRLQIWDAVGKELSNQGIIIHLDNHMSKAFWCCADNDENGWFGSKYFNVENWKRGLAFMAKHVSLSIRLPKARGTGPMLHHSALSLPHDIAVFLNCLGRGQRRSSQELTTFDMIDY
jgi:endoglucanase